MNLGSTSKHFNWKRLSGPFSSLAFHALIIWVAITLITYEKPPEVDQVQVELVELNDLQLEEIEPLEMPELEPLDDHIEPLDNTQLADIVEPVDVSVDMPEMSDNSMLDNLSPLVLTGVGADQGALKALTARYGNRAAKNGLLGTYFNRVDFTGDSVSRIDPTLNYDWNRDSPWPEEGIKPDLFSIIWTGRIVPPRSGIYTLYLSSDDGARLWIDGDVVLDQYHEHPVATYEVKKRLLANKSYQIKYAFSEVRGQAVSKLEWSCEEAGITRQLIPTAHMWADGHYSRQMLAWNEQRGVNRKSMLNPGMIEDQPFSHIVLPLSKELSPAALERLELGDLVNAFNEFTKKGTNPFAGLPEMPRGYEKEKPRERASRDVVIEIL
ncbi:MAG: PA14 domain-containing protein [Kiritimatiellia bacterium]